MEATATIGNGRSEHFEREKSILHLQCVGCDKNALWPSVGLQSGLIGTDWSLSALLGKTAVMTEEVRATKSILLA